MTDEGSKYAVSDHPVSDWMETTLGRVIELKRGYDLPAAERVAGSIPVVSSSGDHRLSLGK